MSIQWRNQKFFMGPKKLLVVAKIPNIFWLASLIIVLNNKFIN